MYLPETPYPCTSTTGGPSPTTCVWIPRPRTSSHRLSIGRRTRSRGPRLAGGRRKEPENRVIASSCRRISQLRPASSSRRMMPRLVPVDSTACGLSGHAALGGECGRGKRYCSRWRRRTTSSAPGWPTRPGAPHSSRRGRLRVPGEDHSKRRWTRFCRRPRSPASSTGRSPARCRRSSRARSSATACSNASPPSSPQAASWSAS